MKLGIIFKKDFQDKYGDKQEFFGDKITIRQYDDKTKKLKFTIENLPTPYRDHSLERIERFSSTAIQLIYLGEWK